VSTGRAYAFDADGGLLRLASEAYRIRLAHLFDPYLAVSASQIEALPHQITAVYGEMLSRQPLRFLLADDPGAGKTIMAGLLVKELLIRGDLERCLIVAPGSLVEQWQEEMAEKFGLGFDLIHRSLERRRKRLEERLREEKVMRQVGSAPLSHAPTLPSYDPDDIDEVRGAEAEAAEGASRQCWGNHFAVWREAGREIIAARRSSIAHLRRPWRAIYAGACWDGLERPFMRRAFLPHRSKPTGCPFESFRGYDPSKSLELEL
jgi:SNF2-related domain